MHRHSAFPPVAAPDARLLILGSLPGAESLRLNRYYAHPRNAFWRLMETVLEEPLVAKSYEVRLERLKARGVALWDVIASAHRQGSLDADISAPEARDIGAFAKTLPDLRAIAFNGGTAARIGRRQIAGRTPLSLIDLPSSSPAYAALDRTAKAERWQMLRAFII